jgi:membrane protease YdiL (CAAX protease family)
MRSSADHSRILVAVLALALAFAALRVMGTQGPAAWRPLLPAGFVLMALTPWLLLDAAGRRRIGLVRGAGWRWYGRALAGGTLAALLCFAIGIALFGTGSGNWYVTIGLSYARMMDTSAFAPLMLHLVFTLPALVFSPVGEEIFFRGVLQETLEQKLDARMATAAECALFAVVHLCHHGVVRTAAGLEWMPLSAALWMLLMFCTAWLFATLRRRSGSLYPAIAAHMAFNGTMNGVIFGVLWPLPA